MKNKDMSRRFYGRMAANIGYSALIACMMEIFLVTNLSIISRYLSEQGKESRLLRFLTWEQEGIVGILLCVLLGILVFSASFLFLQHKSMVYMGKISAAVQNISQGDLNTSIEVVGDDEFSAMAANLNKMVGDIRELMDRERESEKTKNELITNIAHDLRTPLTSIIGYLELLSGEKGEALPRDMERKYIGIAYVKAKRLENLIEDLFGFTKMTYGKVAMKVAPVDIIKLLEQLLEEFYPSFADKNLVYELKSNVAGQVITADGNLLARLFDNLINNAIKYGAEGKRILVRVHATEEIVTVSVTNYGYVIPEEDIPLLFNKFYRVEQSRSLATGGTGLGLAIAKNIVDMHGGIIQASSGLSGTTFTVKLKVNFDLNKENFGKIR